MSEVTSQLSPQPACASAATPSDATGSDPYGVSLMPGGPLFRLYRRTRLADDGLRRLPRRIAVVALIAWLPLLLLSMVDGDAWSGPAVPFDLAPDARHLGGHAHSAHQRIARLPA